MTHYLPALIFIFVGIAFGVALMTVCYLCAPRKNDPEKVTAFECGFPAFENARMRFDVRFYLVAVLFILFDLEVAFLFPWAVVFRDLGIVSVIAMGVFLLLLIIGFAYEWKKGALEWE